MPECAPAEADLPNSQKSLLRGGLQISGQRYDPIRDYAAIGDGQSAALVSRSGSVDWCCLGRFDADPVFCRLVDADRGGFFSIRPIERFSVNRSYLPNTNILRTTFLTDSGGVSVTDFMPVGRRPGVATHDYVNLNSPGWLFRIVEGDHGAVRLRVGYRPSVNFARRQAALGQHSGCIADGETFLYHDLPRFDVEGDLACSVFKVHAGSRHVFVTSCRPIQNSHPLEEASRMLRITSAFWREWIAYSRYRGSYRDAVERSALALKLLTFAPTGAIAAALTSSLPEEIGGLRNWDYRYCWLRDATFTLYALAALGYGGEAQQFSEFLQRVCMATYPDLQIMYGVAGEPDLPELTLDHLEGYERSRPVRTGNGAHRQRQIDIYGEVLDWALLFKTLGGRIDGAMQAMLTGLADFVAMHWDQPDQGLWEVRGAARHYVHGKIMSWVALDRAIRLFGSRPEWKKQCLRILDELQTRGIDRTQGHLLQAFDFVGTDAALLVAPMVALPMDRATIEATIAAVERDLLHGDFVYRYRADDGLEGAEGAFLICSFWLVDALLQIGRGPEAKALFERLLERANDVGLYAEEIEPATGAFLGNFPQAFTHLALIGAAVQLDLYERRGPLAVAGSHADRARMGVGATFGLRGFWAAFKATKRVGRIFSSRESIMPSRIVA